jgi:hypothetical protein
MQKQLIHGVPYFTDKTTICLWDAENPTPIGTYQNDTITFQPDICAKLADRLAIWRRQQISRVRKPTSTSGRRTRGSKASKAEDSDNDE